MAHKTMLTIIDVDGEGDCQRADRKRYECRVFCILTSFMLFRHSRPCEGLEDDAQLTIYVFRIQIGGTHPLNRHRLFANWM